MKTMRRIRTRAEPPDDVGDDTEAARTIEIDVAGAAPDDVPEASGLRARLMDLWLPPSPAVTYAGLVVIALGFALIAYTWGKVAGLLAIPLQLPYLASGGVTAIALIVIGAAIVTFDAGRRDAAKRDARLEELAEVLSRIREANERDS